MRLWMRFVKRTTTDCSVGISPNRSSVEPFAAFAEPSAVWQSWRQSSLDERVEQAKAS